MFGSRCNPPLRRFFSRHRMRFGGMTPYARSLLEPSPIPSFRKSTPTGRVCVEEEPPELLLRSFSFVMGQFAARVGPVPVGAGMRDVHHVAMMDLTGAQARVSRVRSRKDKTV